MNCLGLPDIILQCDPEPSLIRWAKKCEIRTTRANSHPMFSQTITSEQRSSGKLPKNRCKDQWRTMLAALQDHTQYIPTTDNALMKWIVRHAAWLIPRLRRNDVQSPLYCWNVVNLCLLTFQRWKRELGIPRRSWLTGGNPPCGWARATSRTSIWSELTKEFHTRGAYDHSPSTKPSCSCRSIRNGEAWCSAVPFDVSFWVLVAVGLLWRD